MAVQLAATDPTTRTFESTVVAIEGQAVELEETYFYAESGGQPADRGTIDGIDVVDVQTDDDGIWHTLAGDLPADIGDTVTGHIDHEFRRYCMAAHTASHAVYGAARERFADVGYGGFEITPSKVRIDLKTPTPIDDEAMLDLERLTNEVIWENRPVTWSEWPADEVKARDDIAFNVATEVVNTQETVRIVEIEEWDIAACGGTHMPSTGAIGAIAMADRSNPGEGQTRVEFVVGEERIDQHDIEKRSAWRAKARLGVPVEEIPSRIDQLEEERQALESRVDEMQAAIVGASLTGPTATRFERNGASWTLASVPEVEANTAASVIEGLLEEVGDVIAVSGGEHRAHLVVASDGEIAASEVIDTALAGFDGGGGGGSPRIAQAGGIDADPGEIVEYLVDEYAPA